MDPPDPARDIDDERQQTPRRSEQTNDSEGSEIPWEQRIREALRYAPIPDVYALLFDLLGRDHGFEDENDLEYRQVNYENNRAALRDLYMRTSKVQARMQRLHTPQGSVIYLQGSEQNEELIEGPDIHGEQRNSQRLSIRRDGEAVHDPSHSKGVQRAAAEVEKKMRRLRFDLDQHLPGMIQESPTKSIPIQHIIENAQRNLNLDERHTREAIDELFQLGTYSWKDSAHTAIGLVDGGSMNLEALLPSLGGSKQSDPGHVELHTPAANSSEEELSSSMPTASSAAESGEPIQVDNFDDWMADFDEQHPPTTDEPRQAAINAPQSTVLQLQPAGSISNYQPPRVDEVEDEEFADRGIDHMDFDMGGSVIAEWGTQVNNVTQPVGIGHAPSNNSAMHIDDTEDLVHDDDPMVVDQGAGSNNSITLDDDSELFTDDENAYTDKVIDDSSSDASDLSMAQGESSIRPGHNNGPQMNEEDERDEEMDDAEEVTGSVLGQHSANPLAPPASSQQDSLSQSTGAIGEQQDDGLAAPTAGPDADQSGLTHSGDQGSAATDRDSLPGAGAEQQGLNGADGNVSSSSSGGGQTPPANNNESPHQPRGATTTNKPAQDTTGEPTDGAATAEESASRQEEQASTGGDINSSNLFRAGQALPASDNESLQQTGETTTTTDNPGQGTAGEPADGAATAEEIASRQEEQASNGGDINSSNLSQAGQGLLASDRTSLQQAGETTTISNHPVQDTTGEQTDGSTTEEQADQKSTAEEMHFDPLHLFDPVHMLAHGTKDVQIPESFSPTFLTSIGLECPSSGNKNAVKALAPFLSRVLRAARDAGTANDDHIESTATDLGDPDRLMEGNVSQGIDKKFSSAGYAQKKGMLKGATKKIKADEMMVNFLFSYYPDIIDAEAKRRSSCPEEHEHYVSQVEKEMYHDALLSDASTSEESSDREAAVHHHCWQVLRELRKQRHFVMLGLLTTRVRRCIRRKEIDQSLLLSWAPLIAQVYRQKCDAAKDRAAGRFRGMAELPVELAKSLQHKWSISAGRWATAYDAVEFCRIYGAPTPGNALLATESIYDHGYLGYPALNGMRDMMLISTLSSTTDGSKSKWRAVSLHGRCKGSVLGIAPHTMRIRQDPEFDGTHIRGAYAGIEYDPTKIVGTLSFVQYSSDASKVNAIMAQDLHCDTILPDHYSLRILVVTTKPIGPLTPIVVQVPTEPTARRLNKMMEDITQRNMKAPTSVSGNPNDVAYEARTLYPILLRAARLVPKGSHTGDISDDSHGLTEVINNRLWAENLHQDAKYLIAMPRELQQTIEPTIRTVYKQLTDGRSLSWVEAYSKSFDSLKLSANKHKSSPPPMDKINIYQFALIAETCNSMLPKGRGKKRGMAAWEALPTTGGPVYPNVQPRAIDAEPGLSHLASALYMIFAIKPLRTTLSGNWEAHFDLPEFTSTLPDCEQDIGQRYFDLLDQLSTIMRHMEVEGAQAPISQSLLQDLGGLLDDAISSRSRGIPPRNLSRCGDAHETFTRLHEILTDALRFKSIFQDPLISDHDEKSIDYAKALKLWSTEREKARNSCLYGITIGMQTTFDVAATQDEGSDPPLRLTGTLVLPTHEKAVDGHANGTLLAGLVREFFEGDFRDPAPKLPLAILPQYLTMVLTRLREESGPKISNTLEMPEDLILELHKESTHDWTGVEAAKKAFDTHKRYRIVATVHHCGELPTAERVEANYVSYVKSGGAWSFYSEGVSGSTTADQILKKTDSLYMLVLEQIRG